MIDHRLAKHGRAVGKGLMDDIWESLHDHCKEIERKTGHYPSGPEFQDHALRALRRAISTNLKRTK